MQRMAGAGHGVQFSLRVPTTLDVVEEAVDLLARHCLASGLPPRRARFNLRVVLAEALTNAIVYGNAMDPAKRVDVRVDVDGGRLAIHVRDEGDGFDPTQIPSPTDPDRIQRTDGRGLFLIRQLSDEVHFNERGNAICMIMRCA
jgi:serine/threonine-protein kinase RsbW